MADIATEAKTTPATTEKQMEKKEKVEKVVEKETLADKPVENGVAEVEETKTNGTVEEIDTGDAANEEEAKENGKLTEISESAPPKRKSGDVGDALDGAVTEDASPQKKPKLDEVPVENGEAESVA